MSAAPNPYYATDSGSALYYDLVTAADTSLAGDIAIYAELAGRRASILELGTGTGRVAIGLAERGYDVTGIDIAPTMLRQAEAKQRALPAHVAARLRFVRGDLTALALGRHFDAIFVPYFTLAHLQPATSWRRAFAGIARHLAPGGIVALHLPVADQMAAPPPPPDRPVFGATIDGDRMLTLFVAGKTFPKPDRMTLSLDYVVATRSGTRVSRSREVLTYFAADPIPYAERAGLRSSRAPIPLGKSGMIHIFE